LQPKRFDHTPFKELSENDDAYYDAESKDRDEEVLLNQRKQINRSDYVSLGQHIFQSKKIKTSRKDPRS